MLADRRVALDGPWYCERVTATCVATQPTPAVARLGANPGVPNPQWAMQRSWLDDCDCPGDGASCPVEQMSEARHSGVSGLDRVGPIISCPNVSSSVSSHMTAGLMPRS